MERDADLAQWYGWHWLCTGRAVLCYTFVSLLMSNPDIGVATVAAEAGHAQPSTTLMIYTQQYKKRRESIRNQLSRELYEK